MNKKPVTNVVHLYSLKLKHNSNLWMSKLNMSDDKDCSIISVEYNYKNKYYAKRIRLFPK